MSKIMKIIKGFFITLKVLVTLFIIFFVGFVCLQRFSNNEMSVMGYRLFSVATGSMAPMYNINDVILCKKVSASEIKVGDDITYLGEESSYKDKVITHRVTRIEEVDGELEIHTKGIASVVEDPTIGEDQIYGKVVKKLELLSKFHKFISNSTGFFICIIVPILFLVGSEIVQTMVERYEEKLNKKHA